MTVRTISQVFEDLHLSLQGEYVRIEDLLLALHERGFGFILLIFAVPMALPIPVPPGINVFLAAPLILLTAQQALGRRTIWLPKTLRKKRIDRRKLDSILESVLPWLRRIQILVRPRLSYITQGIFSNIIGLTGLLMALTICIPLPLTNTVPSLGIALMAIGVIMRDGLAVLAGALIGMLWVSILAGALIFFGMEGIDILKDHIKDIF